MCVCVCVSLSIHMFFCVCFGFSAFMCMLFVCAHVWVYIFDPHVFDYVISDVFYVIMQLSVYCFVCV